MDDKIHVIHVPERNRYELRWGADKIGHADAVPRGEDVVVVPHVEVSPEYEGRGLGSRLVREMLDDLRARGQRVVPICPFVVSFIRRYPEYADLQA
jgi:predicted GNAT family acetyltransferase